MIVVLDWMVAAGPFQLKYSIIILDLLDTKFFQKVKCDTPFSLPHVNEKGNRFFYIYIYTNM